MFGFFNYYTASLLLGGVISIIGALALYATDHKKDTNRSYAVYSIVSAIWSLGYFAMVVSTNERNAYLCDVVLHAAAAQIPLFFLLFILYLTEFYEKYKKIIYVITPISFFFTIISPFSFFIEKVEPKFIFNYVPTAGPLYIWFTIYFFVVILIGLCVLFEKILLEKKREIQYLSGYVLFSSIVGFAGGASVFFLTFNINIPPYPLLAYALYHIFFAHAVLKHKLFNIKIYTTIGVTLFIWIVILVRILLSYSFFDLSVNLILFTAVVIAGIILIKSVRKEIENREKGERLARYLANANARLRELDKQKTDFVSIASHQLRSPIAAIKGYASLITDGSYGEVPDKLQEPLHRILESGQRISIMVDDFLNITRIEQGRMTYNKIPQDVCKIIGTVIGELRVVAEEKGLTLTMTCDNEKKYLVNVDEGKMKQIFSNLIDNSIKYTPEGSIVVSVTTIDPEHKILVRIKDTGIGIASDELSSLFQKFNRASNANEANVLGTGLGLYIAREIMKAHKGWINVESEGVGKGSTFTVELPVCDDCPEKEMK